MDQIGFVRDVTELRGELVKNISKSDFAELRRMELLGKSATAAGYLTAWIVPNPLSAVLISMGILTRWMLMHCISHQALDRVPGVPSRYTSRVFARGARRFVDWFDWILPEAWAYEHNMLHHYHTGEESDPDLIERNLERNRMDEASRAARYFYTFLLAVTWKFTYYAPETLDRYRESATAKKSGALPRSRNWHLWSRCYFPYFAMRFVILPLCFLPLGAHAVISVLINSVLAEALTNIHSFLIIAPNHAGADLYRFDRPSSGKTEYLIRQAMGSVDYTGGTFLSDYLQAGLNYQIEHHFWPDLPISSCRKAQPKVEAICAKYGVPYRCEPLQKRVKALMDIMVGRATMLRYEGNVAKSSYVSTEMAAATQSPS